MQVEEWEKNLLSLGKAVGTNYMSGARRSTNRDFKMNGGAPGAAAAAAAAEATRAAKEEEKREDGDGAEDQEEEEETERRPGEPSRADHAELVGDPHSRKRECRMHPDVDAGDLAD